MSQQHIVITGASGTTGIGANAAMQLSSKMKKQQEKVRLSLFARRKEELEKLRDKCISLGAPAENVAVYICDVTQPKAVAEAFEACRAKSGEVDVLVNNAGRGCTIPVSELTDEDIDDQMLVNVKSALYCIKQVLPSMKERSDKMILEMKNKKKQEEEEEEEEEKEKEKESSSRSPFMILNVSSILGRIAMNEKRSAYTASKHFLNGITESLRIEMKTGGYSELIKIGTFSPGPVATDFGENAGSNASSTIPGVQDVESCAAELVKAIENRWEESYSAPGLKEKVDKEITSFAAGQF